MVARRRSAITRRASRNCCRICSGSSSVSMSTVVAACTPATSWRGGGPATAAHRLGSPLRAGVSGATHKPSGSPALSRRNGNGAVPCPSGCVAGIGLDAFGCQSVAPCGPLDTFVSSAGKVAVAKGRSVALWLLRRPVPPPTFQPAASGFLTRRTVPDINPPPRWDVMQRCHRRGSGIRPPERRRL